MYAQSDAAGALGPLNPVQLVHLPSDVDLVSGRRNRLMRRDMRMAQPCAYASANSNLIKNLDTSRC